MKKRDVMIRHEFYKRRLTAAKWCSLAVFFLSLFYAVYNSHRDACGVIIGCSLSSFIFTRSLLCVPKSVPQPDPAPSEEVQQ